ncbi:MAG: monofunctional biosynthetic peptidoglycan transglycosylase [Methylobacteriaceae bacterium]|nr:monofunctional biosynthetic peptidoglycan transglycosylase [Methylobacteriaceae bacterium]
MREGRPRRRWARRLAGLVILLALAIPGAVAALGLAYLVATPVSTLMLRRWLAGQPVERVVVPLDAIAPALPRAVLTSEDQRFCLHHGVDWDALRAVIDEADEDGPSRGASTLTMQVAKNLFLWSSRSYIRKGLEIPLALYLDLVWPKRRVMEVYLNVAEWGDGVFGAEAAARRYFGKSARDLTAREALLLTVSLPNPIERDAGRPSRRLQALAGRLGARVARAGDLTGCLAR